MSFAAPWWLLGMALMPLFYWMHRAGVGAVPSRQRRFALGLRLFLVTAVIFALSGASLQLPERRLATMFVIDHSDSISGAARAEAAAFVRRAIAEKPADALAGVVVAGREARVELAVQENPKLGQIATDPDSSRTDLARALRLAAAVLPDGTRRRVVVLSDGRQNSGDARAEARTLAKKGIRVDSVALDAPSGADIAVVQVKAPSKVRLGDEFDLGIKLTANAKMPATRVIVRRGAEVLDERLIDLDPGEKAIELKQVAASAGSSSYRVEVRSDRDSASENDVGSALVLVAGPPRVMVIEGEDGEGDFLAKALGDRGFMVERRPANQFPGGEHLSSIDSIALVDVDAPALSASQMEILAGFVRDLGRGLIAIGGESSWSLGEYRNTLLEEVLPVTSDIKDPKRRPSLAQALVIDVSGSMGSGPGGVSKIDIARAAATQATSVLRGEDQVGVLAFNTTSKWVIPLQKRPSQKAIADGVAKLQAAGGTEIPQAILTAVEDLKKAKAALKHIVLFSDGFNGSGDLLAAAQAAANAGVTLSVVGTGESAAEDLARVAEAGKGRFFPGRDLDQIPQIITNEVITASRKYVNEGEFFPKVKGVSAATAALTKAPALLGYIGTSAKSAASTLLAVGEYDDPLLATWRTGLGVATAWTSDAKPRWSANWVGWDQFAGFWSNVVRETLPDTPTPGFSSQATATADGLEIKVESEAPIPEGAAAKANVVGPEGASDSVELARSSLSSFSGNVPAGVPGPYLVAVDLTAGGKPVYRDSLGAVRSYSAEYLPGQADRKLLREIAQAGGGRYGVASDDVFRKDLPLGFRRMELSRWLMLAMVLLLPLDIALRRISISWAELKAIFRPNRLVPAVAEVGAEGSQTASGTASELLRRQRSRHRGSKT